MSTQQRVDPTTLVHPFEGTSWEECNGFIRAIRDSAWKEGKQRDRAWMADFAALHFSHAALCWHSRLPQDVREDWGKLENALLDRWPPPEAVDWSQIQPTPAAAPPAHSNHKRKADRSLQGVLKVVARRSKAPLYVKCDSNACSLTQDVREALRVRCSMVGGNAILERTDGSSHSWLAVGWWKPRPEVTKGSKDYASLIMVTSEEMEPLWSSDGPWQMMTCSVSASGELKPFWKIGSQRITLSLFVLFSYLRLAADSKAYKATGLGERARFFIEPVP